jgi:hypothetical protein
MITLLYDIKNDKNYNPGEKTLNISNDFLPG